jgi:hypothetical protein
MADYEADQEVRARLSQLAPLIPPVIVRARECPSALPPPPFTSLQASSCEKFDCVGVAF